METESKEPQLEAFKGELRRIIDFHPAGGVIRINVDSLMPRDLEAWSIFKRLYKRMDRQFLMSRENVFAAKKEILDFALQVESDMESGAMNNLFADWLRNKMAVLIGNLQYVLEKNCEADAADEVYEDFTADKFELFG